MILWIVLFVISLFILVKSSDYFTDAAEKIGRGFGVHPFIIGVTIVALGTSLPELITSIMAVLMDSSEVVLGNVLGSNITNIFLVLGISAVLAREIEIQYSIANIDLPLLIGSAFLLGLFILDGEFSMFESILSLVCLCIYIAFTVKSSRSNKPPETSESKIILTWKTWFQLFLSVLFIYLSAKYTVKGIIKISESINIGKEIIAASAVALGTSLPELMVSISAVRKKKGEMAIGNILGSNIFNSFAVMGIPSLFGKLIISRTMITTVLPLMIIATLMFHFMTHEKRISMWEGFLLLVFYLFFLVQLF